MNQRSLKQLKAAVGLTCELAQTGDDLEIARTVLTEAKGWADERAQRAMAAADLYIIRAIGRLNALAADVAGDAPAEVAQFPDDLRPGDWELLRIMGGPRPRQLYAVPGNAGLYHTTPDIRRLFGADVVDAMVRRGYLIRTGAGIEATETCRFRVQQRSMVGAA